AAPASPPSAAPVARHAAHSPARARPRSPKEAARGGGYGVQLGAFKTGEAAAMKHWHVLVARHHAELGGLKPHISATSTAAGRLYRLQAGGLSAARARSLCRTLKRQSQPCIVLRMTAH
ncbi:MAG: SPOR domain-containing protein, partial [Gammaproteobacteria bacterium]|nr:SPOR domain-containing protein [Gammaproteobacteria bacterium]